MLPLFRSMADHDQEDHNNHQSLHIVMFPWLAFGHLLPFLEISKRISQQYSHRISFVSTPRNLQRLPKPPPHLSHLLTFVDLPLPANLDDHHRLPINAESTLDLEYDQIQYLKIAFDALASPFSQFLEISSPDLIIYDFAQHWLPEIAAKLGVPCVFFNIFNASTSAFLGPNLLSNNGEEDPRKEPKHFTVKPDWIPFEANYLAFRLHEIQRISDGNEGNASGVSDIYRFVSAVKGCDFMAVRSCDEFEGEFLSLCEQIYKKPVVPVGLLPPDLEEHESNNSPNWDSIREWLDQHEPRSVVYVAFGSEAKLTQQEIDELALGLELSELPFFWVLRINNNKSDSTLPLGFEERVRGRGLVFKNWAPQQRILAHKSIGGFVNQSGWSSVIEALANGLAMVVLPMVSTQGLVARLVEWKKLGAEIERDERDGSFTRDAVANALKLVMVGDEGEVLRENAKKMREMFGNKGLHGGYMDRFERFIREREYARLSCRAQ